LLISLFEFLLMYSFVLFVIFPYFLLIRDWQPGFSEGFRAHTCAGNVSLTEIIQIWILKTPWLNTISVSLTHQCVLDMCKQGCDVKWIDNWILDDSRLRNQCLWFYKCCWLRKTFYFTLGCIFISTWLWKNLTRRLSLWNNRFLSSEWNFIDRFFFNTAQFITSPCYCCLNTCSYACC
jgi:hypothetical protein